jgi:hypothetical protein
MKNFLMLLIFSFALLAMSCAPPASDSQAKTQTSTLQAAADVGGSVMIIRAVDETTLPAPETPVPGVMDFLKNNVAALAIGLLGFLKVIVNLTPTGTDNKVFGLLDSFISWIIPNFKAGGGKF